MCALNHPCPSLRPCARLAAGILPRKFGKDPARSSLWVVRWSTKSRSCGAQSSPNGRRRPPNPSLQFRGGRRARPQKKSLRGAFAGPLPPGSLDNSLTLLQKDFSLLLFISGPPRGLFPGQLGGFLINLKGSRFSSDNPPPQFAKRQIPHK